MLMKSKELIAMGTEELKKKLTDIRSELMKLNAQVATGTNPKSPGQIKKSKKTIAKILSVLGSRPAEAQQLKATKKSKSPIKSSIAKKIEVKKGY